VKCRGGEDDDDEPSAPPPKMNYKRRFSMPYGKIVDSWQVQCSVLPYKSIYVNTSKL
jgi:hypothetical protein